MPARSENTCALTKESPELFVLTNLTSWPLLQRGNLNQRNAWDPVSRTKLVHVPAAMLSLQPTIKYCGTLIAVQLHVALRIR
jgi:hypothetical protein